jgi:ectoine hydroxylase-related dioxygenase (phytanoyl-CoA dioxygenase family)
MHPISSDAIEAFQQDGFYIVPEAFSHADVRALRLELAAAVAEDLERSPDVFDAGMVHNCMVRGAHMAAVLDHPIMNAWVAKTLSSTSILYAYQSSSLLPYRGSYASRPHVDCPRFIPSYMTNLGVVIPLDDFTLDNGATLMLKGSHLNELLPPAEIFTANAIRATCSAGDMIVFNARLMHAAGVNTTATARHALTLNFCRSFMRQRFDFPRLVPANIIDRLGPDGQRLLGMNVRMPTSLDEFYLPEDKRLYKPNQG